MPAEVDERTGAMLQMLMWRLYEPQGQMRRLVDAQQTEIMSLQDKAYRRFTRNCWKMRQDAAKQVRAHLLSCGSI